MDLTSLCVRWGAAIALVLSSSCSRSEKTTGHEAPAASAKRVSEQKESDSAGVVAAPDPAPSAAASDAPAADPAVEPDDGKRKLEPFLSVIAAKVPGGAYARPAVSGPAPLPKGFDPLTAKGTTTHFADGSDVKVIELELGASDFGWAIAVLRGGKVVTRYDDVQHYALDATGGHLALDHVRPEGSKRVRAREIVDVAGASSSPLPRMHCTDTMKFVDGGSRLLGHGFELEKPGAPHAYVCLFDVVGKLLVEIDAGPHFHHAASIDFINWHVGVLPREPTVVYATREYRSYGNYDLMLLDTRAPHPGRLARLTSPAMDPGGPQNIELDLADVTLASTEVRFRAKSPQGWFWKWQTKPLAEVPAAK